MKLYLHTKTAYKQVKEDINHDLLGNTDLVVTTTGNYHVCDAAMLDSLKAGAVVCNIGHFDTKSTRLIYVVTSGLKLSHKFTKFIVQKTKTTILSFFLKAAL